MPNTCNDCRYYEPDPHSETRGNCHGMPPAMLEAKVADTNDRRTYVPTRPVVAPTDRACRLFDYAGSGVDAALHAMTDLLGPASPEN